MKGWYFSDKDCLLRYKDNRHITAGITHTIKGIPKVCSYGLHASEKALDALNHAPDSYVWFVNVSHQLDIQADKFCGQRRKYYWGFDAKDVLHVFARKQALINIEKAKPYFVSSLDYELTLQFLNTGDLNLRSAAWSAAESAARSAAESAAWSAARSARSAARSAANEMLETMLIIEAKQRGLIKENKS